jgi:hypothetical protein
MTFPPPPPTRFRCPDSAREIIARHVCLSSFSKNVDGELRLLHEEEERCAPLECVTLKTEHFLTLRVAPNQPCDEAAAAVLNGVFRVTDLAQAFEHGDGNRRGYHGGDFRWNGQAGLVAAGTISGMTNAGILRDPVFQPACERCNNPGIMIGRLCGTIMRAEQQRLVGCNVFGVYRLHFDPSKTGGQGGVRGTVEGTIICPCPVTPAGG